MHYAQEHEQPSMRFSCETQLVLCINDWAKSMDKGFRTDIAIFNFSKAFDSVPHCHLFSKLSQYGTMWYCAKLASLISV